MKRNLQVKIQVAKIKRIMQINLFHISVLWLYFKRGWNYNNYDLKNEEILVIIIINNNPSKFHVKNI